VSARPLVIEWAGEFVKYRELFFFLVWRDVKIRYKQTLLGASWAILQPFLMMIVFSVFFGGVANVDSEGVPYQIFSYAALVPWAFFQHVVPLSGNSLIANSKLISKVYFPRAIIPASSVLSGIVDFFFAALVLVGMMFYYRMPLTWEFLWWPVLLLPLVLFSIAIGMLFSALNVKYRDIKYTIPFFVQSMLFLAPVIYSTAAMPEKYQALLRFNPMVGIIDAFRAAVLPARSIDWGLLGLATAVSLVLFVLAASYFYKTERAFADLI